MKNLPLPLVEFLESTDAESIYIADLFNVELVSGQVILATDFQIPVTYGGNTYQPVAFGNWEMTRINTPLGIGASCEFQLTANAAILLAPFNVPILEAVQLGLFANAVITIYRVFMPTPGDTSLGAEIKFGGQIQEMKRGGRTLATGTINGYTFKLNQKMPRNTLQPGCRWVLGSPACTVNLNSFSANNTVGTGTNAVTIVPATPFTQPAGYFTQGVITFTTGRNTGLSMGVRLHASGTLTLNRSFLFPVAAGDAFTVVAGCDHTAGTCLQKFDNIVNFGGTPYTPNYEQAL